MQGICHVSFCERIFRLTVPGRARVWRPPFRRPGSPACVLDILCLFDYTTRVMTSIARTDLLHVLARYLPPHQFETIVLLFGLTNAGEHSYAEAAEVLGVSVNAIRLRRIAAGRRLALVPDVVDLLRASLPHERKWGRIHMVSFAE